MPVTTTADIVTTCAGLKGNDGKCEGKTGSNKCSAIPCNSNTTATTDEVCKTVNNGCVTTG